MRIIAQFHKGDELRFISHLDILRLMQRAMRRAGFPLTYSQGFNPHPLVSFASALALGYTSDAEWVDVKLNEDILPKDFKERLNSSLPAGLSISCAKVIKDSEKSLTMLLKQAAYRVIFEFDEPVHADVLRRGIDTLLSGPIFVTKRTKGGFKSVDLRPNLISMDYSMPNAKNDDAQKTAQLRVEGVLNASGGLQVELLLKELLKTCGVDARTRVHRTAVVFENFEELHE